MKNILIMVGKSNSFYVTVISNMSMKAYPTNSIATFKVEFAHEVDLGIDELRRDFENSRVPTSCRHGKTKCSFR